MVGHRDHGLIGRLAHWPRAATQQEDAKDQEQSLDHLGRPE
jgi:hypothetical protein